MTQKGSVAMSLKRVLGAATAALLASAVIVATTSQPATADSITANQALRIVGQYTGVWNSPPTNLNSGETVDAPLMGNGDVGVAMAGSINSQTFFIGKSDFWSSTSHAIKPLGRVVVSAGGLNGSSYHVVQDIAHAEVRGTYVLNGQTLNTTSWMDANTNLFVTSFSLTGGGAQSIGITLQNGTGGPGASRPGAHPSPYAQGRPVGARPGAR